MIVTASSYEEFVWNNRIKINRVLNMVLWVCTVTGPALAVGIAVGVYDQMEYSACYALTAILVILATMHLAMCVKWSDRIFTGLFALFALDIAIVFLITANANIAMSLFFVPLLALAFCDRRVYVLMVVVNYIVLMAAEWYVAGSVAALRTDMDSALEWFLYLASGYVIETFLLGTAGFLLCTMITNYFKSLYATQNELVDKDQKINEQLEILNSISEIYGYLSIVDFDSGTVTNVNSTGQVVESSKIAEDGITDMNRSMIPILKSDEAEDFATFVNLNTLRERMISRTAIYKEFNSTLIGWFRAQFIAVTGSETKFIYTIQDIDDDKQKEENLLKISNTDELTGLFNRRAYEEELRNYRENGLNSRLILFAVDLNGLKQINDAYGHAAGDELIEGAAKCIAHVIKDEGKAYRTGGDEFQILIETDKTAEDIKKKLMSRTSKWKGEYVSDLTMSIGYACASENEGKSIDELEKIADEKMYLEKNRYYREKGIDRRGQKIAYDIICETYAKILKINLSDDSYQIIKINDIEKQKEKGVAGQISEWIKRFGENGNVHPDDLDNYLRYTDREYLKEYFAEGHDKISIFYRRKTSNGYRKAMMELIPTLEYKKDKQELFLYVKDIDI